MFKLAMIGLMVLGPFLFAANSHAASGETGDGQGAERMIENGTPIKLIVGDTVIDATLNDGTAAKALIAKLPYTVKLQRYAHDYCGMMGEALPYDAADVHSGWKNGDIAFALDGNYFAILYKDEEISEQFDNMVTMGALDGSPSIMDTLDAAITVKIELK